MKWYLPLQVLLLPFVWKLSLNINDCCLSELCNSSTQWLQNAKYVKTENKVPLETHMGSVQFSSVTQWRLILWTWWIAGHQAFLSITNSQNSHKLMSIESVMPSSHLILCRPLLLLHPIPPRVRVFSSESTVCMRWPKYWSFSLSISPSNEHPGLVST